MKVRARMRDGCAMKLLEKYMRFQKVADHADLGVSYLTSYTLEIRTLFTYACFGKHNREKHCFWQMCQYMTMAQSEC